MTYGSYAAKSHYQEMQVQTSPGKLVIALYDGAIRFAHLALDAMRKGDFQTQGLNLGKTQNILMHLNSTLDARAGAIATQLSGIYTYCLERLLLANAHNRADYVEEVLAMLTQLRDAWEAAERSYTGELAAAGAMNARLGGVG